MQQKSLLDKLIRYTEADAKVAKFLGDIYDYKIRCDTNLKILEISVNLNEIVKKSFLYSIEDEIKKAYDVNVVRILPHYPTELFSDNYIPEVILEAERTGIVAKGFFYDYDYVMSDNSLKITVNFSDGGIDLLYNAKTNRVIEGIIKSEFGISVEVEIVRNNSASQNRYNSNNALLEQIDKQLLKASDEYDQQISRGPSRAYQNEDTAPASSEPTFPRIASLYNEDATPIIENGICTIGHTKFDISSPNYVIGEAFDIIPVAISSIDKQVRNTIILGEVFGLTKDANRAGDKITVSFSVTDGNSSIALRMFGMTPEDAKSLCDVIKDGVVVAMRGYAKQDVRKGIRDEDFTFYYSDIALISKIHRTDNAPKKRVELHLHTNMSTMDALIPPDVAVKTAQKWGHSAVAITDHGNVQGFPEAMKAADKAKMKVIYGMEAYFVNDMAKAITGKYEGDFDDEMVVFDIETTGLSNLTCKITEIGAVKIKNGEVIDKFNSFVNPEVHISEEITALTSITDEMVADAPTIDVVLKDFLEFIGDKLLIAHNAEFDVGFIRVNAAQCGYKFNNPFLDTVALSRFINPDLNRHKLDVLANYYNLGEFNHHRACDDAEMLAMIFFAMVKKMKESEIRDFQSLQVDMMSKSDPLNLRTYHQIILVKNRAGLKNLYKLISYSYLNYYRRFPRIPKSVLEKHRDGLIIGSACEAGELFMAVLDNRPESEIEEIVNFYDYLEIQPICNNRFLVAEGKVADDEGLRELNRRIVALGEKYNKPVVATCDAHFLNKEDEIYRKILLAGMKFKDADRDINLYFRTTEEMLEEFSYLGEEKAMEVVVTNTNLIADMIEDVRPIPEGTYTPNMEGAEEDLQEMCWKRARSMYGENLPEIVEKRLSKELGSIISNGFAVLYMIAQKLVWYSESQGYLVGSRGSVGSSFVATMAGISEVNPLPPHQYCPKCQYSKFYTDGSVGSGFDLPDGVCPVCGEKLINDGHDIPFETFLGFYGDKSPDIDLNFSGEVQGKVHKYTEELFGAENVFRAGTLGTLADKTAYGFILKYLEDRQISVNKAEMNRLVLNCVGVKRTTGQHPGGIIVIPKEYEVYDFTPVQHPADDAKSDIVTTHFAFSYLHDTILKLDELGHDVPTKYKWLEKYSGTSVMDVPMNDPEVYELFKSTKSLGVEPKDIDCEIGTFGLPEMGTRFIQQVLLDAKPKNFADLLQISGLTHGTDVWLGNAQDLIKEGVCDISQVIGTRDGIMLDLIRYGLDNALSFKIMESVRKGKGLSPEWEEAMREHNVPEWYIKSCKKIKYMFPKAHAAAYVMSAIRLGWYKVHMPIVFYSAMFTVAPGGFDAEVVIGGKSNIIRTIKEIEDKGKDATQKELGMISSLQLANECYARKIKFLPVDIEKSEAFAFVPENGNIRMPFSSLGGLGENAAANIVKAREESPIFSVEDLQKRAKLTKSVIEILRRNGVLDGINESDQLSFF